MVTAKIVAVDYFVPSMTLTNEDLALKFPEWSVEKIAGKTGINTRHIASVDEFSSDLAVGAARALFASSNADVESIDFLILCTQSPDFSTQSTAQEVQRRLGLRAGIGATDMNLGCSGYIYALGLAKGLVESLMARNVLVVTADTYSKFVNAGDKSVRTIFGDGASASLVSGVEGPESLYAFSYGTDGNRGGALVVPNGGIRSGEDLAPRSSADVRGLVSNGFDLYMDGPAIFNFTLEVVPETVVNILQKAQLTMEQVDLFIFHQANAFMLEHLRKKLGISAERFFVSLADFGNTVSSTIPIAITEAVRQGILKPGMRVMLLGFGVGLSWGGLVVNW
ncbi:ketoacyl-ACP synthase III [Parafrigoribacterium humi]|jgi:3-oxoacyl-[acyl-carrier-protein] synthase-3|uniref:ketoacyl-ACP synthase III n=1 Tax=Parafrigoribacterium humi TaxID=3144664 RepID=UPI0032EF22B6